MLSPERQALAIEITPIVARGVLVAMRRNGFPRPAKGAWDDLAKLIPALVVEVVRVTTLDDLTTQEIAPRCTAVCVLALLGAKRPAPPTVWH